MEETMQTAEVSQEQIDAAWDDGGNADQQDIQQAQAQQDANETDTEPEVENPGQRQQEPADQPELFTVKNREETRQVTRDELISMAQKGWDYDKVRQERDQLRQYRQEADPALELVKSYAQRNNMNVPEYLDFCRKHELMAGGMSQEDAEQKVSFEKERAALDRDRAELNAFRAQQNSVLERARQQQQARQQDISNFYNAYPKVDPKSIPQEVWAEVKNGSTLTDSYTRYENRRLQAEIAALKQNEKNRASSPGSLSGGDTESQADLISRYWDEA